MEYCGKGTFVSIVDRDRLWKDNIRHTMRNQLVVWPYRYGFLADEYKKMNEAMDGKRVLSPYDWSRHMSLPQKERVGDKDPIVFPRIPPMPEKRPHFPRTSNSWYGYKPLRDGRNLVMDRQRWTKSEAFQHDLIKNLKWPMDYWD